MSRYLRLLTFAILIASALLAFATPFAVHAAAVTANIFTDPPPGQCATTGTGNCSLREAIIFANAHPVSTINLLAGSYALTIGPDGSDDATTGDLNINAPTAINGAGQSATIIDASLMTPTRDHVISVGSSYGSTFQVSITGVTIRGGVADFGGGIANTATLTLLDSTITSNATTNLGSLTGGGGISNGGGRLALTRTTVNNNSSSGDGGGIFNYSGILTLVSSTVDGNAAYETQSVETGGGGIFDVSDSSHFNVQIINSTISNNFTPNTGGGIDVYSGSIMVINSTISGNTAPHAGAMSIISSPSTTNIVDSTIANNSSGPYLYTSLTMTGTLLANNGGGSCSFGGAVYEDYNLSADMACKAVLKGPHDLNGMDPHIAPLANNGGPTKTHALNAGSPAIDAVTPGTSGCQPTDQRGTPRPQGAACDIGAYEYMPPPPPPAPRPGPSAPGQSPVAAPPPRSQLGSNDVTLPIPVPTSR